jgi:putative ATP-binding cassette transporter
LLSGLYQSDRGSIFVNNQALVAKDLISYRQLFSTIFADNHLFKTLYGYQNINKQEIQQWLKQAKLDGKVTFESGKFSSVALSTGQRKRLSLVQVLAENKPFLILDEFAANLDPEFKKDFYREWLPALRDAGRTIFVISHDEHYFDVPDQHYLMQEGQLQHFVPVSEVCQAI